MRLGLTFFILLAMVLGASAGLLCHTFMHDPAALRSVESGCDLLTSIFLRAIRMIIAPLVFSTLVAGIAKMGRSGAVGRVAARSMTWFILASVAAIGIALVFVDLLGPGRGLSLKPDALGPASRPPALTGESFVEHVVPTSIFDALAQNEMLQIVVFALVTGIAIGGLGEAGERLTRMAEDVSQLMLRMTTYVMKLAPLGVFAAMLKAMAEQGVGIVATFASYIGGFYVALMAFWLLMLAVGAAVLGPRRQVELLKAVRQPALIALTTTSSEAAYPLLLRRLEEFGVPNRIASFVLPLGYSFNLVGSMVYCTFAALFIAQAYRVTLSHAEVFELLLLLFVTSKGIASVPRASLLIVASTIPYFNLPQAGVLLIMGVDHFLDMGRTATNTVGNALAAASVHQWEEKPPRR